MRNYLSLINHASVLISNGTKKLLTDPWYSGDAFNGGWNLLYENKNEEIVNILDDLNFIWISHEHPDHFSINFFLKYKSIIKEKNIKILFQKNKDQRVASFLKKQGFIVLELEDNTEYKIDKDFKLFIQKYDFYDSALIVDINKTKIINLNDCPISDEKELLKFKERYGRCDFLLSQFSYAAWKGGKENLEWRKQAAIEKIQSLKKQSAFLEAKYTIPFASFIFFSDEFNFYLNDSVNKPNDIIESTKFDKSKYIFLSPYEKIYFQDDKVSEVSGDGILFWNERFDLIKIANRKKDISNLDELTNLFNSYINRIYSRNSHFLCLLISKIKLLNIFQPINIYLKDLDICCRVDIVKKNFNVVGLPADIEMNSSSLKLIFSQDFGFDTLTINGCFEEKNKNAFIKMTQALAIGNLNNLDIYINYKIFFNLKIILLFFQKILKVKKRINLKDK